MANSYLKIYLPLQCSTYSGGNYRQHSSYLLNCNTMLESRSSLGWKRPSTSSSPNQALPRPPLNHVPQHTSTCLFESLQGTFLQHSSHFTPLFISREQFVQWLRRSRLLHFLSLIPPLFASHHNDWFERDRMQRGSGSRAVSTANTVYWIRSQPSVHTSKAPGPSLIRSLILHTFC